MFIAPISDACWPQKEIAANLIFFGEVSIVKMQKVGKHYKTRGLTPFSMSREFYEKRS
jgi:hypothetical protein